MELWQNYADRLKKNTNLNHPIWFYYWKQWFLELNHYHFGLKENSETLTSQFYDPNSNFKTRADRSTLSQFLTLRLAVCFLFQLPQPCRLFYFLYFTPIWTFSFHANGIPHEGVATKPNDGSKRRNNFSSPFNELLPWICIQLFR